jgi:lysozyme
VKRRVLWIAASALVLAALGALVYAGVLRPNAIIAERYPVRGVDVSEYQGKIDWEALSGGLDFAFVKATEGSETVDPAFSFNFRGALEAGLLTGAYHFFSFESPGETQAENFIRTVGDLSGSLPPVVDVELYGKFRESPLSLDETRAILDPLLGALEARYGAKPILYATGASWSLYLKDAYASYPLWIREVYFVPRMPFEFWQYSDVGVLPGFDGPEAHIDLDVFNGSREALAALALP